MDSAALEAHRFRRAASTSIRREQAMHAFYVASRNALFRLRRDLWALPWEKPASAGNASIAAPPGALPPPAARRRRDNDAVGAARRAKETMDRNHLI